MRIGFDAKRAFKNFTGLGNYSRFVLKSLSQHYPSNDYFLYTPINSKRSEDILQACENPNQVTVMPGDMWKWPLMSGIWRSIYQGVKHVESQLEIFHGLSNEIPFIKNKGTKYVVTVHDLLFFRYPELFNPIDVQIYKMKMERSCKEADQVISVSEQTKRDLIQFLQIPASKIEVVYQGFHENYNRAIGLEQMLSVKQKYGLPEQYLLFVSTIEKRKNVQLILKAMKSRSDWHWPLVVVGKPTGYLASLKIMVKELGLEGKVHFLHHVSFEDLPAVYKMAHVFIYPSYFEGFGIPIIEAQRMGVPVITSTGSCFHEAGGAGALYGDPDDPEALAEHIEKLSREPDRSEMIFKGHQNIKRFDQEVISGDLMKIYRKVLEPSDSEKVLAY